MTFHAVCAFRGLGPVALPVSPSCPLCVCALTLSRPPRPPPPRVGVARAPRAVPVLGAGRAVPRYPCPSVCPGLVPCSVWLALGGAARFPFPPYLAWGCALPFGRISASRALQRRGGGGGGAACAPSSPVVRPGGPVGRGVALPRSVPLIPLGRQLSGCLWRRSGHGGRGPHTAPVGAPVLSPGVVRVASLCADAGLLVHRGSCGSTRLRTLRRMVYGPPCAPPPPGRRGPFGGRGDRPLCLGGVRPPAPPWLAGRRGRFGG